jgi:HEPN domain-containing protein
MLDSADHARAWMLKGDSDLLTVRHLLDTNGPYDTACFHAQQADEQVRAVVIAALPERARP